MKHVTWRKPHESEYDQAKRDYRRCCEEVERNYQLQSARRASGDHGAAVFYQLQARTWHQRMIHFRERLQDFIPETAVSWRDLQPRANFDWNAIYDALPVWHHTFDNTPRPDHYPAKKLAAASAYGRIGANTTLGKFGDITIDGERVPRKYRFPFPGNGVGIVGEDG